MYVTINKVQFMHTMQEVRPESFTSEGLDALSDGIEAMENIIGEEIEFDPVNICRRFSEYASGIDALRDLGAEDTARTLLKTEEPETAEENALKLLRAKTDVFECDGGGVIIDLEF